MRAARIDADPLAVLDRAAALVREVRSAEGGRDALREVLGYLSEARKLDFRTVRERVKAIDRRMEADVTTWMEAERNAGRIEGRAELLLELITRRFGLPSAEVLARLHAADPATLDALAGRVLTARTVDELFA
jgi:hypothetical protein